MGAAFDQLVREQNVVGAQVVVGHYESIQFEHYAGRRFPGNSAPVDADTQFCIGSDTPTRLSHEGSMACYRACLIVNLETGFFCAAMAEDASVR